MRLECKAFTVDEFKADASLTGYDFILNASGGAEIKPQRARLAITGRMVCIGLSSGLKDGKRSFWRIGLFFRGQVWAIRRNTGASRAFWVEHLLWCVPVVLWVQVVCGMPLWVYVAAIVIPANGILLIRSFAEHRARPETRERIAIVEGSWILGPLFLFNNLHALHHEAPMIPWYRYNARYRRIRDRLIADNGGLVYCTYFDVARRFLFSPHDVIEHPSGRVPGDSLSTTRPQVSIDHAGIS